MAISLLNAPKSYSYNSPSFKGVPKMNVAKAANVVSDVASNASKGGGIFKAVGQKFSEGYEKMVDKLIVKPILQPLMNSDAFGKIAEKTKNIDNMAAHMSTAGSVVTTATYATTSYKTLNKDPDQKKRAKTLILNQVMVTGLSTLGAYTVNGYLGNKCKKLGYRFREANQGNPNLDLRMKGFNVAKSLLVFAVMYRYIAPVLVTPVASWIGNKIFGESKKPEANQTQQPQVEKAQEAQAK